MTPALRKVAWLRIRLWDAGYRPIAIYSSDADVSGAGKRPRGISWQKRARRDPPGAATELPEPIALNTGILCDGLRALDLDIDDAEAASIARDLAQQLFGCTLARGRHNSPRVLLLYRAEEETPGKRLLRGQLGKIEVLGLGQQFVAYGTHPSGAGLLWSPTGPAAVRRETLPAISESAVTEFFRAVSPVIRAGKACKPASQCARCPANAVALARLARRVATAREGDRNSLAFWAACRADEMVAAGLLTRDTAVAVIAEAATRAGLPRVEATRTAERRACRAGNERPCLGIFRALPNRRPIS